MTAAATQPVSTRLAYRRAVEATARAERLKVSRVLQPEGSRHARSTRQLAAYVTMTACGIRLWRIWPVVGVSLYSLQQGFQRIEERREAPAFDDYVADIEARVRRSVFGDEEIAA